MKRGKSIQQKSKGSAVVLALLVVTLLSVIGGGLLSLGLRGRIFAIRTASNIAARCAADAGMTKALFEMNEKLKTKPWSDSSLPTATDESLLNFNGTFSYSVTGDIDDGHSVSAIGKSGLAEAQSAINGSLELKGIFEYAIFAQEGLDLKAGTVVDWYNYDDDDSSMKIGTNSTAAGVVKLKNGAIINGDVLVGIDGDTDTVIINTGADITGDTYAQTEENNMKVWTVLTPTVAALNLLPSGGTIKVNTTITSDAKYDSIKLQGGGGGKTITIDGDVSLYITGNITLGQSSELQILNNGNSSLTLYVAGNIDTHQASAINNLTQDAHKFTIYGLDTCTSMVFRQGGVFYGAIHAPNANIVFMQAVEIYGAIAAKSFTQKQSAPFHYDASLRDTTVDDEGARFVLSGWSEQ